VNNLPSSTGHLRYLRSWPKLVMSRWKWSFALILALFSVFLFLHEKQVAVDNLHDFYQANALPGRKGLTGYYFRQMSWAGRSFLTTFNQSMDFSEKSGYPWATQKYFSVRFSGLLTVDHRRRVNISITSDDGSLILLDGIRVLDNLGIHPAREVRAPVKLTPGVHSLDILYFQNDGEASLRLDMPADLWPRLTPLAEGLDAGKLWALNRAVEMWHWRTWMALALALVVFLLMLSPYPCLAPGSLRNWLRLRWPHLCVCLLTGAIMCLGLDSLPGVEGDEAWIGLVAFMKHWQGVEPILTSSSYVSIYAAVNPAWLLQFIAPLNTLLVRLTSVFFNSLSLFFFGLAMERRLGRRSGLLVMALMGSATWLLVLGRIAWEPTTYTNICAAVGLYGFVRARDNWWAACLCGIAFGLGVMVHGIFIMFLLGFGLMLLLEGRLALLKDWRLWLGVMSMILVNLNLVIDVLSGSVLSDTGMNFNPADVLQRAGAVLTYTLPKVLSGDMYALFFSGELILPTLPIFLVLLLLFSLYLPWREPDPKTRQTLRGLWRLTLGSLSAGILMMPKIFLRYFEPFNISVTLFMAACLGSLWSHPGWKGVTTKILAALIILGGLMCYSINCFWPHYHEGGRPFQPIKMWKNPGVLAFESSLFWFAKKDLYHRLSSYDASTFAPLYYISMPLRFLEVTDDEGKRGLNIIFKPEPDCHVVFFREEEIGQKKWVNQQRVIARIISMGGYPISLGERLDKKYMAYYIPGKTPSVQPGPR